MIEAGKVQPAGAVKMFDDVKVGPVRTLTLAKGDGGRQIVKVEA